MEQNTIEPTPIYWDGSSVIIGAFTDEGLPVLIPPADHKVPEVKAGRRLNYSEAELDEKFNNV